MPPLSIKLFGKFSLCRGDQALESLIPGKARELLCYLLTHRQHYIRRESLADTLWSDCTTEQSKRYLRKALWQLQSGIGIREEEPGVPVLQVDAHRVRIHPEADICLDVETFETAFAGARNSSGLDCYEVLQTAAGLYQGDLLEGWYQDWCLYDRERLQNIYLSMLRKLVICAEQRNEYEKGIDYGLRILHCDRAHEIAHQHLMRLHYLSGDRAGALRQYEHCACALKEELGVQPSESTRELHRQIREDALPSLTTGLTAHSPAPKDRSHLGTTLNRLQELQSSLAKLQDTVEGIVLEVREALSPSAPKRTTSRS